MISFVSLSPWFSTLLGRCRPRTVSTSKVLAFIFSDKPPFHIRAFMPRSDTPAPAPAPEPLGPVSLSPRNIVDVRSIQRHRYPRRVRFEKRGPDSLVIPSSSVLLARDGVLPRCGCGGSTFVRVVGLFRRCACDAPSSGTDSTSSTDDDGSFFARDCCSLSDWKSQANPLILTTRLT